MSAVFFEPAGSIEGRVTVPADKSITHRGLLLAAFAEGSSRISGGLDAADTRSTLQAITDLGARTSGDPGPAGLDLEIEGVGLTGARSCSIDVGNSGTLIRLLTGLLAGQPAGEWTLTGDDSIASRPMDRVASPLSGLGAQIECRDSRFPPVVIRGARISGGRVELEIASAQVKSAILLAGLNADGPITVSEPRETRDHTELLLEACGVDLSREGMETTISPTGRLESFELDVPGDLSSASFLLTAALLLPGSQLSLGGVGLNPTRTGIIDIISLMGGADSIAVVDPAQSGGEPSGDLRIGSAALRGAEVGGDLVPRAIDELPLVGLLGCFAEGETVVSGAEELRVKESDRIEAVVEGLAGLGAEIEATSDGFRVRGTGGIRGGTIDSRGDHRIAMLGAVAGLVSREGVEVSGFEAVEISYPTFEEDLRAAVC